MKKITKKWKCITIITFFYLPLMASVIISPSFHNKSTCVIGVLLPWWRGRTGDWASHGWALEAASGHTDEDSERGWILLRSSCRNRFVIPAQSLYSLRHLCPCWAALAAGEEVRKEDVWACPLIWLRMRPVGKDQEGSWTSLGENHHTTVF